MNKHITTRPKTGAVTATTVHNASQTRRWALMSLGAIMLLIGLLFSQVAQANDAVGPRVRLATNMGDIVLELDAKAAPKTVANFIRYVNEKHYDGTIFHRVIDGFMIQGGGYTPDMQQKPTLPPIENEAAEILARGGPRNDVGTIAMARTQDPHSATAQFYINVAKNSFLDFQAKTMRGYGYAAFGRVVEGMEIVNAIKKLPTGPSPAVPRSFPRDVPQETVIIKNATLEK